MTNIGTQKAVGYRSVQIISAIVFQFGLTALIGGLLGIVFSQVLLPVITSVLKPVLALIWNPGFNLFTASASLAVCFLTVTLVSFISANRINKLHPLIALRGGLTTHSFKKNPLPLQKSRSPLNLLLALKQLLQNKKQAAAIIIIVAAVTMASVAGLAVSHNMGAGRDDFARMFFGEMPDFNITLKSGEDGEAFRDRMREHPDVRKAFGYWTNSYVLVNETNIVVTVTEDTSLLEGNMLIEGRYPKHSNEIALGSSVLRVIEKSVGDTVTVRAGEIEKEFIVTGLVQFMSQMGFNGIIATAGITEVQPDYTLLSYNVYLREGADAKAVIEEIKETEGEVIENVMDVQDQMSSMMGTISGVFGAVSVGVIAVTVFVVILTLYMVIKTVILRRRRELGIQKAVGFTTLQLMNQIALNMTPVILAGVVIGAVAGYFGFNPMMKAFLSGMGIVRVDLPVPLGWTIVVCAVLVVLAYGVSMLIARRIRKISAYALVSE